MLTYRCNRFFSCFENFLLFNTGFGCPFFSSFASFYRFVDWAFLLLYMYCRVNSVVLLTFVISSYFVSYFFSIADMKNLESTLLSKQFIRIHSMRSFFIIFSLVFMFWGLMCSAKSLVYRCFRIPSLVSDNFWSLQYWFEFLLLFVAFAIVSCFANAPFLFRICPPVPTR